MTTWRAGLWFWLWLWVSVELAATVATELSESNCEGASVAQNSSAWLTWRVLEGEQNFTRVSHCGEALVASSAAVSDRLLLLGGIEYESAQPVVTNPVLVFHVASNAFLSPQDQILSAVSSAYQTSTSTSKQRVEDVFVSPASRAEHASFVEASGAVFLFGGQNREFLADVWRGCVDGSSANIFWDQLVPATDAESVSAAPGTRVGHSFTKVFENSTTIGALVFGGMSEDYEELGELHLAVITKSAASVVRPCTDRGPKLVWRKLQAEPLTDAVPLPRAYHSAMATSRLFSSSKLVCVVIYGGKNVQEGVIFDELWRLCPPAVSSAVAVEYQTYTWELLAPIGTTPGARYGASMTFVDEGKLALAGGSYTFPNDFLSDTWELNVNATQWVRLRFETDFTPRRRGHSLSFFPSTTTLLLFGGKDRYAVVKNRMEMADYDAPFCATGLKITFCSITGNYVCIPCPSGSFLESGTRNCLHCRPGTFSAVGAAECSACPVGTYSSQVGKTGDTPCDSCPAGTYSQAKGAISSATCVACAAGTFGAVDGASSCSSCAAGTFSSTNSSVCELCPMGKWSSDGSASCRDCAAGTYTPRNGSSACFDCPRGFFSDAGDVACSACPANTSSSSLGASSSSCKACPTFKFTTSTGQTECQTCPLGSTLLEGECQLCSAGFYASDDTDGACLPCPRGSYAPDAGSLECQLCPAGAFTSDVGATGLDACQLCDTGSFLDGSNCQACGAGTYPEPSGFCSTCSPGSFFGGQGVSASTASLDDSLGCASCPSMSYSDGRGAASCAACEDDAFSMGAWRNCISCSTARPTSLPGCVDGRNGVLCSGNGECIYGGCACASGWVGGDCSVPVTEAQIGSTIASPAVLYFPAAPVQLVIASAASTGGDIEVQIARSGPLDSSLQATVVWGATNLSATGSSLPATIAFDPGEEEKLLVIPIADLSPKSGCRFFSLALEDVVGADPSAVSSDFDRKLIFYLDDMNGEGGGETGRSIVTQYSRQDTGSALASVVLDRLVVTQATLTPEVGVTDSNLGVDLRDHPLNLLVAIDPTASAADAFVDLLPATIAELQLVYRSTPNGVRMGLLSAFPASDVEFYDDLVDFLDAARTLVTSNVSAVQEEPLDWQWLIDGLLELEAGAKWPSQARRHLLVVGSEALTADSTTRTPRSLADALRAQSVFAFALSPRFTAFPDATGVMKAVEYDETEEMIPERIRQAFEQRDAVASASTQVLDDPAGLVLAVQTTAFSSDSHSLPVVGVTMRALPTSAQLAELASTTVVISIPGLFQLLVEVQEPTHACYPVSESLPLDPLPLSGWADAWHLSTESEVHRLWKSTGTSSTLEMALTRDNSLLRTFTSAVLSLRDPTSTTISLTRSFAGLHFAAGLSLVLRGYWRSTSATGDKSATCQMHMHMTGVNTSLEVSDTIPFLSLVVQGQWNYGYLQRPIPWELSQLDVELACNTSSPGVAVEWAALGLLPDPDFACKCPRGFYRNVLTSVSSGEEDNEECLRCAAGSYCGAGIKRQCPDGTFSFGKAASCETCRDGWICTDGLARLCDPGTYSTESFTCGVCPSGYACRNGKKRVCPAGTFSPEMASDCQSCPPGTISRSDGSSTCELCPLGQTSNYQRDHCILCPAGEGTLHLGQHPCSSCAVTAFPIRTQAEVCTA